jgi:hypothetical protein
MTKESGGTLLVLAAKALSMTYAELAKLLGVSKRTIIRWMQQSGGNADWRLLAEKVFPCDSALAARLASHAGETLQSLGLVPPAAPPPPASAPTLPPRFTMPHIVDSIVCAAAEASDVSPRAVRATLLAAFARARELGLTALDVEEALRGGAS